MPLDDREQRILAEIERQFYEDDPDLARAVKNIDRSGRFGIRWPLVGLVAGLIVVVVFFTRQTAVALVGFGLMVASATALVQAIWLRGWGDSGDAGASEEDSPRSRWPFGRD
jgi:cobalamin synthase